MRTINSRVFSARAAKRYIPEVHEDLFRCLFKSVFFACIITAVVVVIPSGKHGSVRSQILKLFFIFEFSVFLGEDLHVFGITIDVVTKVDEEIRVFCDDCVENWLRLILIAAGTECDF